MVVLTILNVSPRNYDYTVSNQHAFYLFVYLFSILKLWKQVGYFEKYVLLINFFVQ